MSFRGKIHLMKVLLIDDQTLTRVGLRTILEGESDVEIVGETGSGAEGLRLFRELRPDITFLDLRLPDSCAVDSLADFLEIYPKAKIIVVAEQTGDAEISRALAGGACSYILKDISESELIKAVRAVYAGKKYIPGAVASILSENIGQPELTATEKKILEMIVGGKANKEIAFDLHVTENTVKTHVKNIFDKLAVSDRTSAATQAIKRGLVRFDV
jgi:two-component system, NarL family, response regulator